MQLLQHDPKILSHQVKPRLGRCLNIDPAASRARFFEPDSKQWWRKGKRSQRDSYRQRSYDAEARLAAKVEQRKFANITQVALYVRTFMEKAWFQRRFPQFEQCNVEYKPGTIKCTGGSHAVTSDRREVVIGRIHISLWGMGLKYGRGGEIVVLHELAHAVLPRSHRHDRRWVRTFLEFIGCAMGQSVKKIFMIEFRSSGVPFSPVKSIQFTPEHMQKLAAARPEKTNG